MTDETKALQVRRGAALAQSAREQAEDEIAVAAGRAQALREVVIKQKLAVNLTTGDHLRLEAWQIIGAFYGLRGRIVSSAPLADRQTIGYEAHAVVEDAQGGVRGEADGQCTSDEELTRVSDGSVFRRWENSEQFQLRSMAQTRALSKAYRVALGWVVGLAGYATTPAEEMTGEEESFRAPAGESQHFCAEHQLKYQRHTKGGQTWYSHRMVNGEWCNEQPAASAVEGETAGAQTAPRAANPHEEAARGVDNLDNPTRSLATTMCESPGCVKALPAGKFVVNKVQFTTETWAQFTRVVTGRSLCMVDWATRTKANDAIDVAAALAELEHEQAEEGGK